MEWIIGVIIGLLVGGASGWFVQEFRARSRLASQSAAHRTAIAALQAERDKTVSDAQASHAQEVAGLNAQISGLNDQLERTATASDLLESAKAQFSEAAKLTAAEALQNNNQQFLDLAKENFGVTLETAQRELDQRHQQFQDLVKPLSDQYSQRTGQTSVRRLFPAQPADRHAYHASGRNHQRNRQTGQRPQGRQPRCGQLGRAATAPRS